MASYRDPGKRDIDRNQDHKHPRTQVCEATGNLSRIDVTTAALLVEHMQLIKSGILPLHGTCLLSHQTHTPSLSVSHRSRARDIGMLLRLALWITALL